MKTIKTFFYSFFLMILTCNAFAFDGKQLTHCLISSINNTIGQYHKVVDSYELKEKNSYRLTKKLSRNIVITAGDTNFICDSLSSSDKRNIKSLFVENYQGKEFPYPEVDILSIKLEDLRDSVASEISCYIDPNGNVFRKKNMALVEKAIQIHLNNSYKSLKNTTIPRDFIKSCQSL